MMPDHNPEIYRSVFLADDDACLLVRSGLIEDCNPSGLSQFSCTRDEIIGKSPHDFSPPEQPDGSSSESLINRRIAQALVAGRVDFNWAFHRLDRETFFSQTSLIPLGSEEAQTLLIRVVEISGINADSDSLTFVNPHRQQSLKLESLGLMAGGIAHDFNNFLLAIMGNADLLDRDLAAGKPVDELLNEIRKGAGRAADLCNKLLAYSGKGQSHFHPVDLSLIAQEMVPMVKVAISRKIALRLELTPDLPLIEGDAIQIHQVIMNLVVNASEALGGHAGSITLATGLAGCVPGKSENCLLSKDLGDNQMVFLEVRDSGEGMEDRVRDRIFDPYFSTKIRGRGLGLATVLGTMRSHQGSLCSRSVPVEGSAIRVCFPVARVDKAMAIPQTSKKTFSTGRGTILVVDDEEYLRALCSRMLKRLGFKVLVAADGAQALEIYRQEKDRINGVILDLVMPSMDGIEVLERLLEFDPDAKVIMTSGYHKREIATRFSGKGIAGFIQKPYVLSDLGKVLAEEIMTPDEMDPAD